MKNKKGFTLLELLIAATIVGGLAVFATMAYKKSVAETRLASAKTRAEVLFNAVQRFQLDYGVHSFKNVSMTNANQADIGVCNPPSDELDSNILIYCQYLENGGWGKSTAEGSQDEIYFTFRICDRTDTDSLCAKSPVGELKVCMSGTDNDKLENWMKGSKGYAYCIGESGPKETFGSNE